MSKTFSILLPPPNITGSLHIGHYFNWSIQDLILKHKKAQEYETNWYLGLDHAGIATQYVVEKQLKEEGKTRIELGRDAFNARILEWKKEAERLIEEQVENFQFNMKWEKHRFTMDPEHQETVINAFVKLYEDGLITKQNMITNWDTKFNTAISDLEVIERKEKSKIYKIEYKSSDDGESLFISTTRPETIFADTALCMNFEDPRREKFNGKKFLIPLINKEIPLIFDELCELNKGEGVLKVTPAHDHLDYEIGKKHNLEIISIISKEGKIFNTNTEMDGLSIAEAKKKILELFDENNINYEEQNWEGIKKYTEKSNVPVETMITEQWFLDVSKMAENALKESKNIKFYPENLRNTFKNWMTKTKPWCLSRQLWWGHQVPIWYTKDNSIICAQNREEAVKKAQSENIKQDEDVLDTWFSSALWPTISPNNQVDLLVTGKDIIFFWVARMIMFSLYFKKKLPFTTLYFNGIVRDKNNEKMSKTKGNVINPLEINNQYGQDVLRFTLLKQTNNNKDIKLNEKDLELTRNLITKINNANKFIKEFMSKNYSENEQLDNWMEQRIYESKISIEQRLDNYDIQKACEEFYDLFWNNFCNWYIEGLKQYPSKKVYSFFNEIIKIGFPFLPKTIEKFLSNEEYKLENKKTNFNKIIKITKLLRKIKKTSNLTSFYINFEPKMIQNYTKLTLNNQIKSKIICENKEIFIEQEYIKMFSNKLHEEINNLTKIIQTVTSKIDTAKNVPNEIIDEWIEKNKENNRNLEELNSWINYIS